MLKIQNMSRENFSEPKLSFPRPRNLSVPWPMGAPATCNISSLQTLSDFSEGLCHMTTGVWEQRAIWPIRRGGDSVGQIGRFTIGCRPGPCGCHPWTSKMSVPPGIKRQNTNDGTFEARRAPTSTKHHLIDCIRLQIVHLMQSQSCSAHNWDCNVVLLASFQRALTIIDHPTWWAGGMRAFSKWWTGNVLVTRRKEEQKQIQTYSVRSASERWNWIALNNWVSLRIPPTSEEDIEEKKKSQDLKWLLEIPLDKWLQ